MDHVRNTDVLLGALLHGFVMFPKRRIGFVGSVKDRTDTNLLGSGLRQKQHDQGPVNLNQTQTAS